MYSLNQSSSLGIFASGREDIILDMLLKLALTPVLLCVKSQTSLIP